MANDTLKNIFEQVMKEINTSNVLDEFVNIFDKKVEEMGRANIIIAGRTGMGKSTLINAAFRDDLAETGLGRPVTSKMNIIEKEGVPIRIYDTVGLELNSEKQKETFSKIYELISKQSTDGLFEMIHIMWYCISVESERIENIEIEFISEVAKRGVPVILVLTKAFDEKLTKEFSDEIKSMDVEVENIIPILARDKMDFKPYGVDSLVEYSVNLLPEIIRGAWINAVKMMKLKNERAQKIVYATVAANFTVGFVPIPFADMPILVATETSMMASIAVVYGLKFDKKDIISFISAILGIGGVGILGRSIASNLIKLFPGAGSAVGGAISGGTAAALTFALGEAFISIVEMIATGEITKEEIGSKTVIDKIKKAFKNNMKLVGDKFKDKK